MNMMKVMKTTGLPLLLKKSAEDRDCLRQMLSFEDSIESLLVSGLPEEDSAKLALSNIVQRDDMKNSYSGESALDDAIGHIISLISKDDRLYLFSVGSDLVEAYLKNNEDKFYQVLETFRGDPANKKYDIVSDTVYKMVHFISSYEEDMKCNKVSLVLYDSVEAIGFSAVFPKEFVSDGKVVATQEQISAHQKEIQEKYFFSTGA